MSRKSRFVAVPMQKQKVENRIHNFNEVALGYNEEQAVAEAERCIQCPEPECVKGCPVEIDIQAFIKYIVEKDFDEAIKIVKGKNSLPAICGRVCPQEEQCQRLCILGKKGDPLSIGRLERFVADYELKRGVEVPFTPKPSGKKVAVVGAGPAGLSATKVLGEKNYLYSSINPYGLIFIDNLPSCFNLYMYIIQSIYVKSSKNGAG